MGVAAAGPFSTRSPSNVTAAAPAVTSQGRQALGRHVAGRARRRGSGWTFLHTITIQCDRSRPGSHQPGGQDVERMDDAWPRARIGMAAAGPFPARSPSNVTAAAPNRSRPAATSQDVERHGRRVAEGTHRHGGCWTFSRTITIQCDRSSPRPQQAPRPPARTSSGMDDAWPGARRRGGYWTFFHTITIQCDRSSPCNHQPGRRAAWTVRDRARARAGVVAARPPSHAHRSPFNVTIGGTAYRRADTPHTHKINPRIGAFSSW